MKRSIVLGILLGLAFIKTNAQIITQAPYSSNIKLNYVRVWDPVKPYTDDADVINSSRTLQEVRQSTQYFDALGRPLQTVIKKGSLVTGNSAVDLVFPIIYDEFGREIYRYLPGAANTTGGNSSISDGIFKLNPFQQDSVFNKGMFSDENYFYSQKVLESAPGGALLEAYAPGDNWVGSSSQSNEANRHGVKVKYWLNKISDSVRVWTVTDISNGFGTYASNSIYDSSTLYKTVIQDEHNNQVIEFKDTYGKVVLKKVQLSAVSDTGTGKNHTGWLCTYYVYDELHNLRCVIQPKAVELLASNGWSFTSTILDELCFRYEYDGLSGVIMKKMPGAGVVHLIYDARSRLVMTQDSIMRADHKWLYTLYDAQNRDTTSGLITDNTYYNNAAYHRGQAENSLAYPNPGSYPNEVLTKKFYDNYGWRGNEGNPLSETRSTSYDSYLLTASNSTWPYPQDVTLQSNQLNGLLTGTKTKVLGTNSYLYTVSFYDHKAQLVQFQSTNITNGTDINIVQHSWIGQPLLAISKQEKAGLNAQTTIALTKITPDDLGRPWFIQKKISNSRVNSGDMPSDWKMLNYLEYDALGQLQNKLLDNENGTPLETLDYDYNIRGWLLGLNRGFATSTATTNWFGFDLGYDKTSIINSIGSYSLPQYNGNITGITWKSTGDDEIRKYDFTYDDANRIISADFNQYTSGTFNKNAGLDFSVSGMDYDGNGNILSMKQKGWRLGGSVTIDSLNYSYTSNTNKLLKVVDGISTNYFLGDFKDGTNGSNIDYLYDGNGSLIKDKNKYLDTIHYNLLHLPDSIVYNSPNSATDGPHGYIKYQYDANGTKLKKIVFESCCPTSFAVAETTTTTTYINNFIYESQELKIGPGSPTLVYTDTLLYLPTEEGRARVNSDSSAIVYDYMIKDHLGNVRMVLTEETKTDEYPPATMEYSNAVIENSFYSNIDSTRSDRPANWYFTCPGFLCEDYVAKVNGGGHKIGPAIMLKVLAGDKFNMSVFSYWESSNTPGTPTNLLPDLLSGIGSSASTVNSGHLTPTEITNSTSLNNAATAFLNSQSYNSSYPKAYVNWILLDEHFNYVASSSGFEQVGSVSAEQTYHSRSDMPIDKSGYLYVYVSNVTDNIDVFFDNLQVTHIRGPLVEESHYYPFGLTMKGISSKALSYGGPTNKYKFNSGSELSEKDFTDNGGLDLYETSFRGYDHQIGRFHQVDLLAEETFNWNPYNYCLNNPIRYADPLGLDTTIQGIHLTTSEARYGVTVASGKDKSLIRFDAVSPTPSMYVPSNTPGAVNSSPSSTNAGVGFAAVALTATSEATLTAAAAAAAPYVAATAVLVGVFYMFTLPNNQHADGSIPAPGFLARDQTRILPPLAISRPTDLPITITIDVPYAGHGNKLENTNPHMVYVFSYTPTDGGTPVLKYGICDLIKNPNRPVAQKVLLASIYGGTVDWKPLTYAPNRVSALAAEKSAVTAHFSIYGRLPRAQILPKPW